MLVIIRSGTGTQKDVLMKVVIATALALMLAAPAFADNGNHFGWTNGGGNPHGAPGPLIGAGLPVLLVAGGYWVIRRFRKTG